MNATGESKKSLDGDWCLIDLSDPIPEETTKVAHELGISFYDFMCPALEEKLAGLRGDKALDRALRQEPEDHYRATISGAPGQEQHMRI